MAPQTGMMTAVTRMHEDRLGADTIMTMTFNPTRCAVPAEVAKQKVANNETYFLFFDSLFNP